MNYNIFKTRSSATIQSYEFSCDASYAYELREHQLFNEVEMKL